ncbi:PREDICTED: tetratricopeptide repeat protein 29, partial [Buceros rhinoceros silvestris]|uniref:tetratricopeptide repeat protein 29 n=1 Tax=Buceros rhinoceros silvestris TaxID=175836 RepID=UPI0005282B8B
HYEKVYDNQLNLAYCFNDFEDKWLSNYFYEQCFNTAQQVKIDGGKREAQAHADMGIINEEQGHIMKAAEHYEAFYELTEGLTWKDETGRTYNSLACEHLWRIYTLLADKMLENKEHQQAIKTLIKALKMAKEGGDRKMEGEAAYCLSLAHNFAGEERSALSLLNTSVQIFTALCDSAGLGRAYAAIARILLSQGKAAETIKYLGEFMKTAENAHLSQSLVDACVLLGNIYNERGNYNEAFEYFSRASEAAKTLNNLPLAEEIKTYCGIAKAHKLMLTFNSHIEAEDPVGLKYLLAWKNRSDMFTDPLTVGGDLGPSASPGRRAEVRGALQPCRGLSSASRGSALIPLGRTTLRCDNSNGAGERGRLCVSSSITHQQPLLRQGSPLCDKPFQLLCALQRWNLPLFSPESGVRYSIGVQMDALDAHERGCFLREPHTLRKGETPRTSLSDVPVGEFSFARVDNPRVKPAWTKPAQSPEAQTDGPAKVVLAGVGKLSRVSVSIPSAVEAN